MIATVRRAHRLEGEIRLPGDKSMSHRALMLASIASGRSSIRGLSTGADVHSTRDCLTHLGVDIDGNIVHGVGLEGMRAAPGPLDCGNSGTTMRLLAGLLSGQAFVSELTGDASLSRRPMDRVVEPLRRLGANAAWPPLRVGGGGRLVGTTYEMPIASAQVKSAILLAGLRAEGTTTVVEPVATRNHTELMLAAMGANVRSDGRRVELSKTDWLEPLDIDIPGDFSAAAFWLVAAGLIPASRVRLLSVGVNPTRTALADSLTACGLRITQSNLRAEGAEPVADLEVTPGALTRPIEVKDGLAGRMIDELPVLAVAATQMPGRSVITGAAELKVKESDRLAAIEQGLLAMGADIKAGDDGWVINGPTKLEGAKVGSAGDHRVAMAFAIAGLMAQGKTEIDGAECVDISYPGFFDQLEYLA